MGNTDPKWHNSSPDQSGIGHKWSGNRDGDIRRLCYYSNSPQIKMASTKYLKTQTIKCKNKYSHCKLKIPLNLWIE